MLVRYSHHHLKRESDFSVKPFFMSGVGFDSDATPMLLFFVRPLRSQDEHGLTTKETREGSSLPARTQRIKKAAGILDIEQPFKPRERTGSLEKSTK